MNLVPRKLDLSLPTYVEEAREKSSATKEMANSVLVALLIFLAANSSLSLSSSDGVNPKYNRWVEVALSLLM